MCPLSRRRGDRYQRGSVNIFHTKLNTTWYCNSSYVARSLARAPSSSDTQLEPGEKKKENIVLFFLSFFILRQARRSKQIRKAVAEQREVVAREQAEMKQLGADLVRWCSGFRCLLIRRLFTVIWGFRGWTHLLPPWREKRLILETFTAGVCGERKKNKRSPSVQRCNRSAGND